LLALNKPSFLLLGDATAFQKTDGKFWERLKNGSKGEAATVLFPRLRCHLTEHEFRNAETEKLNRFESREILFCSNLSEMKFRSKPISEHFSKTRTLYFLR